MKNINGRELKALLFLSVVAPISLLAAMRLTGILNEPIAIADTISLASIDWESDPMMGINAIGDVIRSAYANNEVSLTQEILVNYYYGEDKDFGGSEMLSITVNVTARTQDDCNIRYLNLTFYEDYENSLVDLFYGMKSLVRLGNLTIDSYSHWMKGNVKASFSSANLKGSTSVYLWFPAHWALRSDNPGYQAHILEIISEMTYFNGTGYRKIAQPFELNIRPDNNNRIENAEEVGLGSHKAYVGENDPEDYYKIRLEQGQVLQLEKAYDDMYLQYFSQESLARYEVGIDICIFDPNRNARASLAYGSNATRYMSLAIDVSGLWYILVTYRALERVYVLKLSV